MRIIGATMLAGGLAAVAYPTLLRPWWRYWGATAEEVARVMPGDELLADPELCTTRAITVEAPPSAVWPWLVQMGSGRGGAYTYDWIENLLGLNMHSADEVLPQFQHLEVGNLLPVGEGGPRLRVAILDRERELVLHSEDGAWVWLFGLYPQGNATRLVSRNRITTPDASRIRRLADVLFMEPASLVMERKMLLGIKQRAEHLAGHAAPAGSVAAVG
jgi:hypothetical protein